MAEYHGSRTAPLDLAVQAGLPGPRSVLLAPLTGGVSTTADFEFASLVVPAGFLIETGLVWTAEFIASFTKATGTMNLVPWVKVNGTKLAAVTLAQANAAQTAQPVHYRAALTVRSLGASGVIAISSMAVKGTTAQVGGSAGDTITLDTSASVTIAVGANLSVANAGHSLTAHFAKVGQG